MPFFECIAIILRRNIGRIGRRKRQNRLSGGFMTAAWQAAKPADASLSAVHGFTRPIAGRSIDKS
jgi:hypothetical protein